MDKSNENLTELVKKPDEITHEIVPFAIDSYNSVEEKSDFLMLNINKNHIGYTNVGDGHSKR